MKTVTGIPSQAKRQAILDAATAAFLKTGYAVSVDDIAASAGVGKQTVYRHFGDKQALFMAALAAARASRQGESDGDGDGDGDGNGGSESNGEATATPDPADPAAGLAQLGEQILGSALSPTLAALHRLIIAEIDRHPELSRHWGNGAAPFLDREITGYLRACGAAGTLDVPDPARAARQFAYLLITEGRMATAYGTKPLTPRERRAIAAETADLIARAYRPAS
jgi:TetR/AcrR family transcriptional repressor of mexJK operon